MERKEQQVQQVQQAKSNMKRGPFGYAVERKSELPQNAREMKLILHIIRKQSWDKWNELKVYDFGSDEEVFIVTDSNYLRVPDPEERYYFYFYTENEDGERQWHYVKIEKGATSMKGFLTWNESYSYVKNWVKGEIYKIKHATEEAKKWLE
jgi:viroplasmin and RNaseH domain-containing protein